VETIRKRKILILNWLEAKKAFHRGVIEGLNKKENRLSEIPMD